MKTVSHRLRDQYGYSMVEVLAAIVILSLAILPMVSMFDAGLRAAVLGGNYDTGRALANANLEDAKSLDFADAEALTDCPSDVEGTTPTGFDCDLDAEPVRLNPDTDTIETASSGTMLRITVTVNWDDGTKTFETAGLLSLGGV